MIREGATLLKVLAAIAITLAATEGGASDVAMGRLLAASHCAVCHAVTAHRSEIAEAPGFELIGLKYHHNPDVIAIAILAPHPRMNFVPRRADAEDIASYIATLPR